MSALPKPKRYTVEEYYELEDKSPSKNEYYDGRIVPLNWDEVTGTAGAADAHNVIAGNIYGELRTRLKGKPCQPRTSDMKVRCETARVNTYPDVSVVCCPPQFYDKATTTIKNPTVLVEVLSDSTARHDCIVKLRNYKLIPSVREYLIVDQYGPTVICHRRVDADEWEVIEVTGLDGSVRIESLATEIPMSEVYANVRFEMDDAE